jgi:hypothetical protein
MSRDAYENKYTTLGIAAGGVYATIGDDCNVTMYDRRLSPYYGDLAEGGIVIDKRPCLSHSSFIEMVISGPMLKESLPSHSCERMFSDVQPCDDARCCKGMDCISMDLYLDLWRPLGAKIGKRVGNEIVWENGDVSVIPDEKDRWKNVEG